MGDWRMGGKLQLDTELKKRKEDGRKTGRKEGSRRGKTRWQCNLVQVHFITKCLCQGPAGEMGQGTALGCR